MVSVLVQNAKDVDLIPALGTMFPIFITPTTLVCRHHDPVQGMRCVAIEPTLYMYMYGRCLYVCNCKH